MATKTITTTTTGLTHTPVKEQEKKVVKTDEKEQGIFTRAVVATAVVASTGALAYAVHKEYIRIPFSSAISQFFARLLGLFSGSQAPTITSESKSPAASGTSPTSNISNKVLENSTTASFGGDRPTAFGLPEGGDLIILNDFVQMGDEALEWISSAKSSVNYYWHSFVRNSWNLGVAADQSLGQFVADPKQTTVDTAVTGTVATAVFLHPYLPGPESSVVKLSNKIDDSIDTILDYLPTMEELASTADKAIEKASAIATITAFDIAHKRHEFIADHNQLPISYYVGSPIVRGIQHGTIALGTLIYDGSDFLAKAAVPIAKMASHLSAEAGGAYTDPTGYLQAALPRLGATIVETMTKQD